MTTYQLQQIKKKRVYHLEDANLATARVKERIESSLPQFQVESFTSRLELNKVWERQQYPAALIVDLLVPEKYVWVARVLLGHPGGLKGAWYWVCRKFIVRYAKCSGKIPDYLMQLKEDLIEGRNTHWGGLEFLCTRLEKADQSVNDRLRP